MRAFVAAIAVAVAFSGTGLVAQAPVRADQAAPVDISALVRRTEIPHETFTLANGLRVIVHENRETPVVAVSVWYNVGSKDEPAGRSGFAHLFEHLMFNGSENAPGDYFEHTAELGATGLNGTTSNDRTNYFQTVPTGSLERALFLESDRMGYFLGALTQENLTAQIAVVQNERRQRLDNQPFGQVSYFQLADLFPENHPYRHPVVGSMADLSAATLADVQRWFRERYGPNNAVLVLSGDINAAEASRLVERYFGAIPRGPANEPAAAPVTTLPARLDRLLHDRVANTRLYRSWIVPGYADADIIPLSVGATILGGLASSRLDNELVRGERSATSVTAGVDTMHRVSQFEAVVNVRPGQDPEAVGRRLDAIIADLVERGPTEDEVRRTVMRSLAGRIAGLENAHGRGAALAENLIMAGDAAFHRRRIEQLARVTPIEVRDALRRWLRRPVYALTVAPGERDVFQEPAVARAPAQAAQSAPVQRQPPRTAPPISDSPPLDFPAVERARLSNGIEVTYARRSTVPVTRVALEFNAGSAADAPGRAGIHGLMLALLSAGTTSRDATRLAEERERLGASVSIDADRDRAIASLTTLTPSLDRSLDLLADIVRNPAFAPAEVERLRAGRLASMASARTQASAIGADAMQSLLYGDHPYGRSAIGDEGAVRSVTRDELARFHQTWIRPDNARIFVVSDQPLAAVLPQLEAHLGNWGAPAIPRGVKSFPTPQPARGSRIVLIDRPESPQSYILAGMVLPIDGTQDRTALNVANEILGGGFISRINMELRERRGWSYGASSSLADVEHQVPFLMSASVQADRTGDSVTVMIEQLRTFLGPNGVQAEELSRAVFGRMRQLPGQFQGSTSVLGALMSNAMLRRPDDYWEGAADRFRRLTGAQVDEAARRMINPDNLVWVVVGDAARVRPQLERLGLPIELRAPPARP